MNALLHECREKCPSLWHVFRAMKAFWPLWVAVAILISGPAFVPYPPDHVNLDAVLEPPSMSHWLGSDWLGRDWASRLLWGGRFSYGMSLAATGLSACIGISLGVWAGVRGGRADAAVRFVTDFSLSFPVLFLLLLFADRFAENPWNLVPFMGFLYWIQIARVTRAEVQSIMAMELIRATRALGAGSWHLWSWHVLPRLWPTMRSLLALTMANILLTEAAINYLGLGIQPPQPSWGRMIAESQPYVKEAPWLFAAPSVALLLSILSLYRVTKL